MGYRQIIAKQNTAELRIIKAFGDPTATSGIYVFTRKDDAKDKICAYIGQAKNLRRRIAQHLIEYDHIALSLKKYGVFSEENQNGWKCEWRFCSINELDKVEKEIIANHVALDIYELYNITSGGQGNGKTDINPRAERKGYNKGKQVGYKKAYAEIGELIRRYTGGLASNGGKLADRKTAELLNKLGIILEIEEVL